MASIVKVHAVSGAYDESPHCYLLQVDEFKILLDLGWDEFFSMKPIEEMRRLVSQVDVILLSYPDPLHLGALPHLREKIKCPVYATVPVHTMGQLFMYDLYQSRHSMEDFALFSLDDVDEGFDLITRLKYGQSVQLPQRQGRGVRITPLPSGHMLGGTMWRITNDREEDIVYAVDFNHTSERHLNRCAFDSIQRPSLLITDAFNASYRLARRRSRDEQLRTAITSVVRSGGNVLIAVDTAGRMLEVAHMLEDLWGGQDSGLAAYSLAMASNVATSVVHFAKSQVEWMSDKMMRSFEKGRSNPFKFKHLIPCYSQDQIRSLPEPKVVLASMPDLEAGHARELFTMWASSERNAVILTTRTSPGTLARTLIDQKPKVVHLTVKQRVPLVGKELADHMHAELVRKESALRRERLANAANMGPDSKRSRLSSEGTFVAQQTFVHEPTSKRQRMSPGSNREQRNGQLAAGGQRGTRPDTPPEPAEVPTKCIARQVSIPVLCRLQYIDFEGRSDGESIRHLVQMMKPKQLVIVRGGSAENTQAFVDHCVSLGCVRTDRVFAPRAQEVVDVSTVFNIYQVKLDGSLLASLNLGKANNAELAWIDAEITEAREDPDDRREGNITENLLALRPVQDPRSRPQHNALFINDVRLSDFKQVLTKHGISSEFSGGVLHCNDRSVSIKRIESGGGAAHLTFEGFITKDYYRIRALLYEQYVVV